VHTRGNINEEPDSDCIRIPLAAIFGYDGENIGELTLENIGSILIARSSETGLWTGGYVGGQNWQAEERELLWTVGDENEGKNAWELVCGGRGVHASFYRPREGERRHKLVGIAYSEGATNWPLRWQFHPLVNGIWWGK
jgi:hypothetical protein